jgi:two-component system alkaline phosphatase synthesis response regulator PhoP
MNRKRTAILVAGDNTNDLSALTAHLQTEGFEVIPVANRISILTIARSEVPSLIILDLQPCFDFCRALKHNFVTEPIPVIAILSPAEEMDRVAALELGADDCVAKPVSFRELTLRIKCSLIRARDKRGTVRYNQAQNYAALTRPSIHRNSARSA